MEPIDYGMFIMPYHDSGKPLAQCFDEDLELVVMAEELGFSEFWIGEHHTVKYESIAMPEIFIGAAMRETERIRMGPAPVCLDNHHPVGVASRLAFLDHLCKGRLNLCVGPSGTSSDMEIFGTEPKKAGEMVEESLGMVLKLWSSDPPYRIEGKYWNIVLEENMFDDIGFGVVHKPFQQPHPPIFMPGTSRGSGSMRRAGARGFRPISHYLVTSNVVADMWQTYEQAALGADRVPDPKDWRIMRAIFIADTTEEARERVRSNSMGRNFEYIREILDRTPSLGRQVYKRDLSMADSDVTMDYFLEEQIIAGNVDGVLRRLLAMVEETGDFGTLILMGFDWDDKQSWVHSMELFARELMPALNKAVGAAAA